MTTIGDVLLVFAVLVVSGLSLWGTMVATTLLFPNKSARMAQVMERRSVAAIATGFFLTVPAFIILLILGNVPSPIVKFFALFLLFGLLVASAVGGSGQVRLLADRVKRSGGEVTMFGSLGRAAMIIVLVFNIPLVGWLFMVPLSMMAGLGSLVVGMIRPDALPSAQESKLS